MNPNSEPIPRVSARKYRGAGDIVAAVAKPIAKAIDTIAGTDLEHCQSCEERRKALNAWMPIGDQSGPPPGP